MRIHSPKVNIHVIQYLDNDWLSQKTFKRLAGHPFYLNTNAWPAKDFTHKSGILSRNPIEINSVNFMDIRGALRLFELLTHLDRHILGNEATNDGRNRFYAPN